MDMKVSLLNGLMAGLALISLNVFSQDAKLGVLKIENGFTRATVPGQKVTGGYLKIENKGVSDQLISASSPAAGQVELHMMKMDGNVMQMRQIKEIDIPANGSVELKPGGLHLMLMDLKTPLKAGETIPVKLKFAKAGELEMKLSVKAVGAEAHGSGQTDPKK
jgi:copper(I)-binding protein